MVIDDNPEILEVKVHALTKAGFEVEGQQQPNGALLRLSDMINSGNLPYALITDTDMHPFSGPELITYISPKTNRNDALIEEGSRSVINPSLYRTIQDFYKVLLIEGLYQGRQVLTSRQELMKQTIDQSLPRQGRLQLQILNEALRISDRVFKIDANGKGMDGLVGYLRS